MNLAPAADYARKHDLHALLVWRAGELIHEEYAGGYNRERPHALYSGTKSFWGIAACLAQREALLELDERVWSGATVSELLSMTAGAPFGGLGRAVPAFQKALASQTVAAPGVKFTYSGIPFQIFGAIFAQRLAPLGMTPLSYLQTRLFELIDLQYARWRTLPDGTHTLPTGAELTAANWLKYGVYLLGGGPLVARCFTPNTINPRYGLGFWLATLKDGPFVAYASGSGKQALYVLPSEQTAIVHFAQSKSFAHETFLRRIYFPPPRVTQPP